MNADKMLSIEVGNVTGLREDLSFFAKEIKNEYVKAALNEVMSQMSSLLKKHIYDDVYAKYQTKDYPRRDEVEGERNVLNFGYGLADEHNMHYGFTDETSIAFTYRPSGHHSGRMQDTKRAYDDNYRPTYVIAGKRFDLPIKPHPVHGDELINRIQTGTGFDWNLKNSPEVTEGRPFWDNFVDELRNGAVANAFNKGFKDYDMLGDYPDFSLTPSDIKWDANEGYIN